MTIAETVRMWQRVMSKNGRDDIGYIDLKGSVWGNRIIFDPPPVTMPLTLGELGLACVQDGLLRIVPLVQTFGWSPVGREAFQSIRCAMWHRRAA